MFSACDDYLHLFSQYTLKYFTQVVNDEPIGFPVTLSALSLAVQGSGALLSSNFEGALYKSP